MTEAPMERGERRDEETMPVHPTHPLSPLSSLDRGISPLSSPFRFLVCL